MDLARQIALHNPLSIAQPAAVRYLRDMLRRAEFTVNGINRLLKAKDFNTARRQNRAVRNYHLRSNNTLSLLVRLFLCDERIPLQLGEEVLQAPTLEAAYQVGLLAADGDMLQPLVHLSPWQDMVVASDMPQPQGLPDDPLHVMGLALSSQNLAGWTVRRPVRTALDIGTGSGIQALLAARHSDKVIATDPNPRALSFTQFNAAFNGLRNIETRLGGSFDPVPGEKFDLIVANPPFVITPQMKVMFRDSGYTADRLCEHLIREAPNHLQDGGMCQLLCEVASIHGQSSQERLSSWLAESQCDAWAATDDRFAPESHAAFWINQGEKLAPAEYETLYHQWLQYYRDLGIEGICLSVLSMRKRKGTQHRQVIELAPKTRVGDCGHDIYAMFEADDFIRTVGGEAGLLRHRFVLHPLAELRQDLHHGENGWTVTVAKLQRTRGLCFHRELDGMLLAVLGGCNGQRTLGELLNHYCARRELDPLTQQAALASCAADLLRKGFIIAG